MAERDDGTARVVRLPLTIQTWGSFCEGDFVQCPWLEHAESVCLLHGELERDRSAVGRKRWARHGECLALDAAEGEAAPRG